MFNQVYEITWWGGCIIQFLYIQIWNKFHFFYVYFKGILVNNWNRWIRQVVLETMLKERTIYFCHCMSASQHRRKLPVINYYRIKESYPYLFLGIVVWVTLHDFIRQNYHKNESNCYPFRLIMVNYPFSSLNNHILSFSRK